MQETNLEKSEQDWQKNETTSRSWIRLLYIILFFIIMRFTKWLVVAITLFQFVYTLFKGMPNQRLLGFSASLSQYIAQIILYLNYNSNDKPFPFSKWPGSQG